MFPLLHVRGQVHYPASAIEGMAGTATHLTVTEEVNRHTLLQARHQGRATHARETLRSGTPMIVELTAHKGTRRWFGYVDHVLEKQDENHQPYTEVIGVGVTYPMKEPVNYVLGNLLRAERNLIKDVGLVPIVKGPDVDKPVVADGRSQWQILVDAAQQFSQYVFTTGTTVNVLRLSDIIELYAKESVSLAWMGGAGAALDEWSLQRFEVLETDNYVDRRTGYGVDPLTAGVNEVGLGSKSIFGAYPKYVSRDVREQLGGAVVTRSACASGKGHIGVTAGKLVHIVGSDPGPWWMVKRVVHDYEIDGADYTIDTELSRFDELTTLPSGPQTPSRNIFRIGDFGERVSFENNPTLYTRPTFVQGAVSWHNAPRWRPKC